MVKSSYGLTKFAILVYFIVRAAKFRCSVDQAKRSFYRAASSMSLFVRVERLASEEVKVQLLKHKCLPILLYPSEVCNLIKGYCSRLTFFTKLFRTSNIETAHYCWRGGVTGKAFGPGISRSQVQILLEATLRNNLRQVVYTYVPLSPTSIAWYRPKGGDALRLGR